MQIEQTSSYPPPIDQLLTYGEAGSRLPETWPNYLELGLGSEHIPDLIRMVDTAGKLPKRQGRVSGRE